MTEDDTLAEILRVYDEYSSRVRDALFSDDAHDVIALEKEVLQTRLSYIAKRGDSVEHQFSEIAAAMVAKSSGYLEIIMRLLKQVCKGK
jgi:phage replication-related protein YjqB (UPF0714/DUF867 family)